RACAVASYRARLAVCAQRARRAAAIHVGLGAISNAIRAGWRLAAAEQGGANLVRAISARLALHSGGTRRTGRSAAIDVALGAVGDAIAARIPEADPGVADPTRTVGGTDAAFALGAWGTPSAAVQVGFGAVLYAVDARRWRRTLTSLADIA